MFPKRALLSVSNKEGIVDFAKQLIELDVEIISTGGTSQLLKAAKLPHLQVEEVTGLPEMLDGRVKTLHPKIHGGILGKRDQHAQTALEHGIAWIDLVVVNFYPFAQVLDKPAITWDEVVEYIDIGGPTMVRAAAKNFAYVGVVVDPSDYAALITNLREQQELNLAMRQQLACKAFALTAQYEAMIHAYFLKQEEAAIDCRKHLPLLLEKSTVLRYGENPHQKACAYQFSEKKSGILSAHLHQGKPLSYNNILDLDAGLACCAEFSEPACVIIKHANPCGAAIASTIEEAYHHAYQADALSAFGGIVALNRPCTEEIAKAITAIFMEAVIAPGYTEEALAVLATKPNLRVLTNRYEQGAKWEMRFIDGGVLCQEKDQQILQATDLQVVTKLKPTQIEIENMLFAWQVLKHIKSNGILLAKDKQTIGIGAGQVSRVDAVEIALRKAGKNLANCILASDAFFPFRDSIDKLAGTGVRVIIQPGGSIRDEEVIQACDQHGIAMVFTGKRCFRH